MKKRKKKSVSNKEQVRRKLQSHKDRPKTNIINEMLKKQAESNETSKKNAAAHNLSTEELEETVEFE